MLYIIVWLRPRVRARTHTHTHAMLQGLKNVLTLLLFVASCRALLQDLILFDFLAGRMRFRLGRWLLFLKLAHLVELSCVLLDPQLTWFLSALSISYITRCGSSRRHDRSERDPFCWRGRVHDRWCSANAYRRVLVHDSRASYQWFWCRSSFVSE